MEISIALPGSKKEFTLRKTLCCLLLTLSCSGAFSQGTIVQYLSGTDKDHTISWDFFCTGGRNSGKWTKIAVPSNWELQGFGAYNYGHDKVKSDEQGRYRHPFPAGNWKGKKVFIVFEGSMTDTKVMINGVQAGPVHQGSFYRFKYDITNLVRSGAGNLLEVTVNKNSANASVNDAERRNSDFWVFGGIFRPVYLEIVPGDFIDRVAIDAKADGAFAMDVYAGHWREGETIEAQVETPGGEKLGRTLAVGVMNDSVRVTGVFDKPLQWSAEFPRLYRVVLTLKSKGQVIHRVVQRFGFRTVELRQHDGLYVNGSRIMLKGCNRHSFWPETGRTLSRTIHLRDVQLMKEMNMNAVRMSHYPPDAAFLDICDSLGLYVLDELTGWQAKYDTVVGRKLVKELVVRDVNHPSVVAWDNGNEGGWNRGLDKDYALYDPQERVVLHPWEKFNGADTRHYPDYNYVAKATATGQEVFFPTEFMHGLYDGGAGAGLDDFWDMMLQHPHGAGGFIWALLDEAVIRTDKGGEYDGDGNHAPDGIVGPHREKEASFYTIKEIWSPVHIGKQVIDDGFNGEVQVENRYSFTNIKQCTFSWKLVRWPSARVRVTAAVAEVKGALAGIDVKPGEKGVLRLGLPKNLATYDALYLSAFGPDKREIYTWSWPVVKAMKDLSGIGTAGASTEKVSPAKAGMPKAGMPRAGMPRAGMPRAGSMKVGTPTVKDSDSSLKVACDGITYFFDKSSGYLLKIVKGGQVISLSGGPALAGVKVSLQAFSHRADGSGYIVEADYKGEGSLHIQWTFRSGHPAELAYAYSQTGAADYMGITFNYPEEKITGMKWLGRGPYRVWKNRLKGQQLGVWHKAYNNSITGERWGYPEFKGYHAEVSWVVIENKEAPFTMYMGEGSRFFQMLHPAREKAALTNNNVEPAFPEGAIGILDGISAIGTKFQSADVMGPQSQKNQADGRTVKGRIWLDLSSR